MPKRKAILRMPERQEPSIWAVAPIGSTISLISRGMPISEAASRLTGSVAVLLPEPRAMSAGAIILLQKTFTPRPSVAHQA